MAAYVIIIREQTTNPSELETYSQKALPALEGHPGKLIALYGRQDILEGPEVEGAAILEFPTLEDAQAWYNSPAYQEALQHRLKSGSFRALIVEGL